MWPVFAASSVSSCLCYRTGIGFTRENVPSFDLPREASAQKMPCSDSPAKSPLQSGQIKPAGRSTNNQQVEITWAVNEGGADSEADSQGLFDDCLLYMWYPHTQTQKLAMMGFSMAFSISVSWVHRWSMGI